MRCNSHDKPLRVFLIFLRRLEQIVLKPIELVTFRAGQIEQNEYEGADNARERGVNDDL